MRVGKIVGVWAMIAGLLFWNGVLALGVYKPFLGAEAGEMMAAFIAMGVMFGASRPFLIEERELPVGDLARVSILWMILTLVFEVGLGRLAQMAVPRAAPMYGMWDGSFWVLIVLASAAAPVTWLKRHDVPIGRVTK
jgi:hypothetical protein